MIKRILCLCLVSGIANAQGTHADLIELFADWRDFERPPMLDGAPDYTAETFARRHATFTALNARLDAFDIDGWPVPQQVDWHLVRAEMNGYDFNHRVLKPWARDPAFYDTVWMNRSDVPAHEGPTNHAVVEVWTYDFPLSDEAEAGLVAELAVIPPLMRQAQRNLTGNARDLWVTGIRDIRSQMAELDEILELAGGGASDALRSAVQDARAASEALVVFLEDESPSRTGPSGIGKDNYTWSQQNVHYVPLTWEDEVFLLKRELDRGFCLKRVGVIRNVYGAVLAWMFTFFNRISNWLGWVSPVFVDTKLSSYQLLMRHVSFVLTRAQVPQ